MSPKSKKGRFVLLGDAACFPTAFMGGGTVQALVGDYVFTGEIKWGAHYAEAFHTYEARVRPYGHAS